jgi:hypothetical protein
MNWFTKKKSETETLSVSTKATRDAWWNLYVEIIRCAIDDQEELLRCQNYEYAQRLASSAKNLADAALEQFEMRFLL